MNKNSFQVYSAPYTDGSIRLLAPQNGKCFGFSFKLSFWNIIKLFLGKNIIIEFPNGVESDTQVIIGKVR